MVSGVLGPLLLLLYMDDISHWLAHSSVQMFTDDIALYKEITSPSDLELLDIDLSISKGFAHKQMFICHRKMFSKWGGSVRIKNTVQMADEGHSKFSRQDSDYLYQHF